MCGIAGAVWTDADKAVERATLQRMIDVLRHRGPDDEGAFVEGQGAGLEGDEGWALQRPVEAETTALTPGEKGTVRICAPTNAARRCPPPGRSGKWECPRSPGVALGHRRLSIIDVAGGHQPLANEDGSVWIVFNGEIYNFPELRRRLEQSGHRFRTGSDTEVLVHLYEDEGPEMLAHLHGMFAFAVWDARRRQLLLARDRLGQKPLVYRCEPGRLLFASELKSLLQVPGVPREIDPQALDEYLTYQYVPHPRTIFRGIAKLPPGHLAVYESDRLEVQPYWQPDFNAEEDRPRRGIRPRVARTADRGRSRCGCRATCRWGRSSPAGSTRRSSSG